MNPKFYYDEHNQNHITSSYVRDNTLEPQVLIWFDQLDKYHNLMLC